MTFLYTWNSTFEGQPDDTENVSLGASRIRGLKSAISERMAIDHSWAGDESDGLHKQVTMPELSTKPTVAANQGAFYVKAEGATTAPYFEDDAEVEHRLAIQSATWPIGSVFISVVSTSPATLLGFGTWEAFATGRTLVGIDTGNALMDTVEETFGQANAVVVSHNHGGSTGAAGAHSHTVPIRANQWGSSADYATGGTGSNTGPINTSSVSNHSHSIATDGESGTNKNYQPSIVVYMWKRTA